jgi:hypothetical protein
MKFIKNYLIGLGFVAGMLFFALVVTIALLAWAGYAGGQTSSETSQMVCYVIHGLCHPSKGFVIFVSPFVIFALIVDAVMTAQDLKDE